MSAETNRMLEEMLPKGNNHRGVVTCVAEAPAAVQEALQEFALGDAPLFEQAEALIAVALMDAINKTPVA